MASPQIDNGFLRIANEICQKFQSYRLSGEEWLVLWVILNQTYGWNKPEDKISLSQFALKTNLDKRIAHRALKKLSSKKMIVIIKKDDSIINSYRFNKDFDKWLLSSKKMTLSSKKMRGIIKKDDKGIINIDTHNRHYTKDTITKDIVVVDIQNQSLESPNGENELTPAEEMRLFCSNSEKRENLILWFVENGKIKRGVVEKEVNKFISYWTEPTKTGKQERWEKQETFDVKRRLLTWFQNYSKFNK